MTGIFRFFASEQCKTGKPVPGETQINLYCEPFIKNSVFARTYLQCSPEALTVWNTVTCKDYMSQIFHSFIVWTDLSKSSLYYTCNHTVYYILCVDLRLFKSRSLSIHSYLEILFTGTCINALMYCVNFCVLGTIPENPPIVLDSKKSLQDPFNLHTFIDSKRQDLEEKGRVNLFGDNSQFQVKITNNMEIHLKVKWPYSLVTI